MILELTRTEASDISYFLRAFCCEAPKEYPDSEINSVRALAKNVARQYDNAEYAGPDNDEDSFIEIELNLDQAYDIRYYLKAVCSYNLVPELNFQNINELRSLIMSFIKAEEEETIDGEII